MLVLADPTPVCNPVGLMPKGPQNDPKACPLRDKVSSWSFQNCVHLGSKLGGIQARPGKTNFATEATNFKGISWGVCSSELLIQTPQIEVEGGCPGVQRYCNARHTTAPNTLKNKSSRSDLRGFCSYCLGPVALIIIHPKRALFHPLVV